jgi:hypothetical protein
MSGSNREDRNIISVLAVLVNPLAKRLDIVEDNVEHCIFADVAVEVLIASFECYQCLIGARRDLKLLDRSGFDGVTSSRNEEHCECKIRWIKRRHEVYIEGTNALKVNISNRQAVRRRFVYTQHACCQPG